MDWQYTPYIVVVVAAALASVGLASYAWRRRATRGAKALVLLMLAVSEWSLGYVLELARADLSSKLLWAKIQYVGIVIVPTAWLVLAIQYAGYGKWLTRRRLVLLAVHPIVMLLLTWTNEVHRLVWAEVGVVETSSGLWAWSATYGVAFWVHTAYSYVVALLGAMFIVHSMLRSPRLYRSQAIVLLTGLLAPWAGNALSVLGPAKFPFDLTPVGFAVSGLVGAWGLFYSRLLDVVPIARDVVVEGLPDGVIVLDTRDRIVDLNPSAGQFMHRGEADVIGRPIQEWFPIYPDLVQQCEGGAEVSAEITVPTGSVGGPGNAAWIDIRAQKHYELRISALHTVQGHPVGRVALIRDVTERKRAEEALRAQKSLFEGLVAVARATAERPTLEATLRSALTAACELTGAEHGTLLLLGADGAVTHSLLISGQGPLSCRPEAIALVMDRGLAGWVARHREAVLVYDTLADGRWLVLPDSRLVSRSALAVPIVSGTTVLGILTLTHPQPGHFSVEHADLMQAAADQMRLALRNAQIFDLQLHMADRQAMLYQVLRAVVGQLDPGTVMQVAAESISQSAEWPSVVIVSPSEDGAHWVVRAVEGKGWSSVGQEFPIEQGIVGRTLRVAQTQWMPDEDTGIGYTGIHPAIRSELAVPLRQGERVLGVLDLQSDQPSAFGNDDVLLAESLAEVIALAMENARLYAEANRHVSDLDALYAVTRVVSQSLALQDVLTRALSAVLLSFGFEAGFISLVDPVDDHLEVETEHGLPSVLSRRLGERGLEGTLSEHVHIRRESLALFGLADEVPVPLREAAGEMAAIGIRAFVGVPLLHRGTSLGSISLFAYRPRMFSESDLSLLEAIGRQVATSVANARLFQVTLSERQRLLTLIESSHDGIVLVGMDARMLVVSAPAIELLRLSGDPAGWGNLPIQDALEALKRHAPDAARSMAAEMDRIQAGDETAREWESTVPPRTIHWLSLPVVADAIPLGRLLVLRDVTQERLLAKMREDLTHTMVHDLRNPLTGISTALRLLARKLGDVLSPAQQRLLEIADSSTERMVELVNAILDMSRLESERMPLNLEPVSLFDLVRDSLHLQLPLAAAKSLKLESDVSSALPQASVDVELIRRVLQNLVGNAIKFTPPGGTIRVEAREGSQKFAETSEGGEVEPAYLEVRVIDNGPGVSPALQSRLFEKFVVGEHKERGSGLGLALCKLAVEAHGGRIWVESTPGEGATFVFALPVAVQDAEKAPKSP